MLARCPFLSHLPGLLPLFTLLVSIGQFSGSNAQTPIDLTAANRRPPISGLPDWSKVGFMQGAEPLPDDSKVTRIISPAQLASEYGVIPNDGIDDTDGLQRAIEDCRFQSQQPSYTLLQLPAGVINLSYTVFINADYLIIRGTGNDPDNGGTKIVFTPNADTKYDVLTQPGNDQWDIDEMSYSWDMPSDTGPSGLGEHNGRYVGSASAGWLWPGRSIFRIGSKTIAPKFTRAAAAAPSNRLDFFYGTINYHWRIDKGNTKGFMASQLRDIAGYEGQTRVYINNATEYPWHKGAQVWIASPVRAHDYTNWGVTTQSYYVNSYVFQDWFTVTAVGNDTELGPYLELDHPLRFTLYANSGSDGSPVMEETLTYAKVMPIEEPIVHVGVENLYMTQPIAGHSPSEAERNYGNLVPEQSMHGIVLRYAKDCWVRNIRTYMTGSHPVATEAAKNIQVQDSFFDGAWNKGKGGNGYLRGSRVWDSLYFNITQRNLRHFTFQWCALGNVAMFLNVTNDLNLHGGYEGYNLLELNYVAPPYSHRSGRSTGEKASKWSGATGPQNIFYRNYMIKQPQPNVDFVEYQPYFARDGSLSETIWQFGWDRLSSYGTAYQHLSQSSCSQGACLLRDWQGNEQFAYNAAPGLGVNGQRSDTHTSLFLRDVTNATNSVSSFSSIAGFAYCRGKVAPKVIGYYLGSAASRACSTFPPEFIDWSAYSHILFGYASLASDGTVTVPSDQQANLRAVAALKAKSPQLKVYLAVGGYGLGADATAIKAVSNSGSARTKLGNTAKALLTSYNLDGLDVEWPPNSGITANQFTTIATTIKTAFGTAYALSLSTPAEFWQLSGLNKVTIPLAAAVDFISLLTHAYTTTDDSPNTPANIRVTLRAAQVAGFPPEQLLMGIPFYAKSQGSARTSSCVTGLGQGTYPYYAIDSILNEGNYDEDEYQKYLEAPKTSTRFLTLSDGTSLIFDDALGVAFKSGLSTDLCMGGVSVFSIDQDDDVYTLTNAIWDAGGILPPAADIAYGLSRNAINSDGLVNENYMDAVSSTLANQYPNLPVSTTYRILLYAALAAEASVANQLRHYLSNTALAGDDFALYKKWETKAINWAIANATGIGNQHWECAIDQHQDNIPEPAWSQSHCAGSLDHPWDDPITIMNWRLKNKPGFKDFLNQSLALDVDSLIPGSILVDQKEINCINIPTNIHMTLPENSVYGEGDNVTVVVNHTLVAVGIDDGTGRVIRPPIALTLKARDKPDPYDPDPDCNYNWTGVYLLDPSTFFSEPRQGIQDFLTGHDIFLSEAYGALEAPSTMPYALSVLLETALTNIAQGNGAINSTLQYLEQLKFDQALEAQLNAWYKAREAAFMLFLDIALTIIGFLPGLEALQALALARAGRFIKNVADALKAGRITRDVAQDANVARLFGNGLHTADEMADASRAVEGLLSPNTLRVRGKVSEPITKANNRLVECAETALDFLLDAGEMGTAMLPPAPVARKRSIDDLPGLSSTHHLPPGRRRHHRRIASHHGLRSLHEFSVANKSLVPSTLTPSEHLAAKRAGQNDCIWEMSSADSLKGFGYAKHCTADTMLMKFPAKAGGYAIDTYKNCKTTSIAMDKAFCQCDHLFEAIEILETLKPSTLTDADIKALCNEFPDTSRQLREKMNSADNMRGLSQRSNTFKTNLLSAKGYKSASSTHTDSTALKQNSLKDGNALTELENLEDYMSRNHGNRQKVAKAMDTIIDGLTPSSSEAVAAWAKVHPDGTSGLFEARRLAGDKQVTDKLPALKDVAKDGSGPYTSTSKKRKATKATKDGGTCNKKAKLPPGTP
ncbi:hypothetical protein HGRIS_013408 [Hohenbuehelia grisea]|uniref:GH18 domain-containing protein n=1 Tax=Hohenbuehelia grisea TaxID=104357 RepID=A0ABR3IVH6_9AGAR